MRPHSSLWRVSIFCVLLNSAYTPGPHEATLKFLIIRCHPQSMSHVRKSNDSTVPVRLWGSHVLLHLGKNLRVPLKLIVHCLSPRAVTKR